MATVRIAGSSLDEYLLDKYTCIEKNGGWYLFRKKLEKVATIAPHRRFHKVQGSVDPRLEAGSPFPVPQILEFSACRNSGNFSCDFPRFSRSFFLFLGQRAENGGLDPSWLYLAFLGRPRFSVQRSQDASFEWFGDLWTENREAPKTPNPTTTDPTPHSRPSDSGTPEQTPERTKSHGALEFSGLLSWLFSLLPKVSAKGVWKQKR